MAGICEANVLTHSFPKPFSVFEKGIKLRFSTYQNHRKQYVSGGFSIITLVLKAAKQPLTTARSAGEIKA